MGSEYGSNDPTFTQRESCFSWTGCITTEKHGEGKHKKNPLKYSRFHAEEYSEPSLDNDFQPFITLAKHSTFDVRLGPKYASVMTAFFEYILASNNYTFSEVILTMHKATETTDLCIMVMSNKSLSY